MHHGSCLCGAVSFDVHAELEAPDACHCSKCRRASGHFWVSTNVRREHITILGGEHVTWFRSSEKVQRGFCSRCGSQLFWDPLGHPVLAVAMGAFDKPTNTTLAMHIFVADKGDYYAIADGAPQHPQWPHR